jgi:hypothetical protein
VNTHLKIAEFVTNLLEEQFTIAGRKVGIEPILGFIPGIGDLIGLALSFYLIWIANRIGLPEEKISKMVRHVIVDFLLGLFPVVGDIGDIFYKANSKNLRILKEHANSVVDGQVTSHNNTRLSMA